jgi:hypothetical protein
MEHSETKEIRTADLRRAPRRRVLKSARIVFDDWRIVNCAIRDLSETGAQLRLESLTALPHKFRLVLLAENTIRPVQVAWKHNETIGVSFTGEASKAPLRKW